MSSLRIMWVALLSLCCVSVWYVSAFDDKPMSATFPSSFECRWTESTLTIDGEANEPAWQNAQAIETFHMPWLGEKDHLAKAATRAKLLWDREYLYFFAEMDDEDLYATVKEHDGQTWNDDVFELFFRPAADKPGYFEFQVNAAGTVFDCFFPKQGEGKFEELKKRGEFHIESKVKLRGTLNQREDKDRGWSVEGRIPWSDFLRAGGRPEPGETWRFALCRYDYVQNREPELSTMAPLKSSKTPNYHLINDYASLRFEGPTLKTAGPLGIQKYTPVTTSRVVGFPDPPPPYRMKRLYPNYRPEFAICVRAVPGTDQMLVINQPAAYARSTLWRIRDDEAITAKDAIKVLDTPDEGTAYDITFHPKFAANGYVYIGWNGKSASDKKRYTRVTRYTMDRKPPYTLDPSSAVTIIEWESNGHNGGAICFGNDGMLYVTSGDGTSDSDTNLMGQRTDSMLAKLLRIDLDHVELGKTYSVPKDNPFVADARFVPETWAYGLRNPWRIACDPKTGHIWIGNNGQDLWETAYFARKGDNYGWSVMEGSHPFYLNRKAGPTPITKPTIEHHHSEFRSLTGGIVCYDPNLPELAGAYLYGDHSTGRIWGMKHDDQKPIWHKELAITSTHITGFGTNSKGNLLVIDHGPANVGGFYTLEPTPPAKPSTFPKKLSESGLFDSVQGHRLKPGVVPYSVNAPFWSDGLYKERYFMLPKGEQIPLSGNRGWEFPNETVIVKSFAIETMQGDPASRKWIETRFLTKQGGEWFGYSYLWNDQGTDGELVAAAGKDRKFTIRDAQGKTIEQTWHYPSRAECMVCHSRAANFVLGLSEHQFNKDHNYGACTDNQLRVLEYLGLLKIDPTEVNNQILRQQAEAKGLKGKATDTAMAVNSQQQGQRSAVNPSKLLPKKPGEYRKMVDPYDPKQDLTLRAKSWLHSNCSSCHVEAGGGNAQMELEFLTPLDKMRIIDTPPVHHTFEIQNARLIAPGDPDRSILLKRISTRGPNQMPPLSTHLVDERGVALIREWISSLKK